MNNILKLSLAAVAIAALSACGGGGSSDAADAYVGTWKTNCFAYTGKDGNTYYQTYVSTFTKANAAEIAVTHANAKAHSNSACTNVLGDITAPGAWKLNIGAKTTFLGASVDAIVWSFPATGEARPGYMTTDSSKMSLVVVNTDGSIPTGWSATSPYTKQ
jgi:hypothetical protein